MVESVGRRDIFLANLDPAIGSEQGKIRPVLIIQNNVGNRLSPVTIAAAITSKRYLRYYPINVEISKSESNLKKDSTIMLNQIRTIDKTRLIKKLDHLNSKVMNKVNQALKISLDLQETNN